MSTLILLLEITGAIALFIAASRWAEHSSNKAAATEQDNQSCHPVSTTHCEDCGFRQAAD
ncbi:hypothetical protein [Chitinilyticum aquatile]|uniref:hypothetical protein n=1 Tax=Chitinilyticum aquatile TaxID=362520 RepID=UPI00041719BB|nr:hypothetical protein [Chitinilyticum aquatile]